ncbi:MAG: ABC transporter substrate-binding protein [Nitrospina sp.]|nr:ABC transporter substrate-binding protein [Nitrospina sp.]
MDRKTSFNSVAVLLILILSSTAWGFKSPIYVGFVGGSSPGFEKDCRESIETVSFIFDMLNQKGGINGHPVHLIFKDDHNNPDMARKVAFELSEDKRIKAVIGHGFSSCAMAAGKIYHQAGLACVSPMATHPKATGQSPWMFSLLPDDTFRANRIACYLKAIIKARKIIVCGSSSTYGRGLDYAFSKKAERLNITLLDHLHFDSNAPSFEQKMLKKIKPHQKLSDAVVILSHIDNAARIAKTLRENNIQTPIIMPGMVTPDMIDILEGHTENIFLTTPFLLSLGSMEAVEFSRQFKNKFGSLPSTAAYLTADAGNLILDAIGAGAHTRRSIRDYIASLNSPANGFHGITGHSYFNQNGACVRQVLLSTFDKEALMPAFLQIRSAGLETPPENVEDNAVNNGIFLLDGEPFYLTHVVYAGIDISRIDQVDTMSPSFSVNFCYWFLWQGDLDIANIGFVNDIQDPGDKSEILRKDLSGLTRYICYRARRTFRFPLDLRDFPFDSQELPITFAHKWKNANLVRLAADLPDVNLQPLNKKIPNGWRFLTQEDYTATYRLHTTFGDPRQSEYREEHVPFSIYRYAARVQRLLLPYYVTLFLPMLILMVMPLVVFWIPLEQVRSRLASLTGALLSILLFHLTLTSSHPKVGYLVRADYFFLVAYTVIVALYVMVVACSSVDKGGYGDRVKATRINRIAAWIFFPLILILEALMMLTS